jgi:hypothetical protein
MKSNGAKKMIVAMSLVIMLLAGIGSATVYAQGKKGGRKPPRVIYYRYYDPFWHRHYDPFWSPFYYNRYRVVDPIAYQREQGFREGKDEGEEDAEKGRPSNARGHEDYVESDSIHFREAFVQGYNEGYREEIAKMREKAEKKREKHGD